MGDLSNFIIDLDDEDCRDNGLHVASYRGESEKVEAILEEKSKEGIINARIRPFLATPLRLAVTGRKRVVHTNHVRMS